MSIGIVFAPSLLALKNDYCKRSVSESFFNKATGLHKNCEQLLLINTLINIGSKFDTDVDGKSAIYLKQL